MTAKIEFFYTHGHTYTATGVITDTLVYDDNAIQYIANSQKENLDIEATSLVTVQKHDLKFAIVTFGEDDEDAGKSTLIIHGLVEKFNIAATFAEAAKIRKQEAAEREAAERFEYKRQREAEKFVERRKKRSAERKYQFVGDGDGAE